MLMNLNCDAAFVWPKRASLLVVENETHHHAVRQPERVEIATPLSVRRLMPRASGSAQCRSNRRKSSLLWRSRCQRFANLDVRPTREDEFQVLWSAAGESTATISDSIVKLANHVQFL